MADIVNSHGFSSEQCEKLIQMFKSVQTCSTATESEATASANLAGMHYGYHVFTSFFSTITHHTWIIDSGSSQHMTFDKSLLHNILIIPYPIFVTITNSFNVKVNCVGSLFLTLELELHNVFYVPTFKHDLLSVSQLCAQFDCDLIISKYACTIQTPFIEEEPVSW